MSFRNRVVLLSTFFTVAAAMLTASTGAQDAPDARFGTVDVFWAPEEAAKLNIGWERILFYWREIQPEGPDDWNTLHVREEWLDEAREQGRTVVGLLKNTPPWASEDGTEAGIPKGLHLPIDHPENLWATFVRKVSTYYSVRNVHHWIIWNEPEIAADVYGHEFAGSVDDYYRLLKVAYQVIKQVDSESVVHLAGLSWWHDQDYLRRFLEVATSDPVAAENDYFFDVLSLHIYFQTESVPIIVDSVKAVLNDFEIRKPIWINETNASPNIDPLWPVDRPDFEVDLDQQAWYLVQAHALGFAAGASSVGVYKLVDIQLPAGHEPFGILRPDFSPRPAYDAYRTTIKYLSGFTQVSREQRAGYHLVTFYRPDGQTRVMWARLPASTTLKIPALVPSALLVNALGETERIWAEDGLFTIVLEAARCRQQCIIGGPPLFLVEDFNDPTDRFVPRDERREIESAPDRLTSTSTPAPKFTPSLIAPNWPQEQAVSIPPPTISATRPITETVIAAPTIKPSLASLPNEQFAQDETTATHDAGKAQMLATLDVFLIIVGAVLVVGGIVYIKQRGESS